MTNTDISTYCIPDIGTHRSPDPGIFLYNRAIVAAAAGAERANLASRSGIATDPKALLRLEEIFNSLPSYRHIAIQANSSSAMVIATWGDTSENSFTYELIFSQGRIETTITTFDEELVRKFHEWGNAFLVRSATSNRGRVDILVQEKNKITTSSLGYASIPLSLENYSKEIHKDIIQASTDLNNPFPPGRLTVLDGPPGGGKTFLIRSLISEVPNANFVFVPPPLIPSLGDPHLVSALIQMKEAVEPLGGYSSQKNAFSPIILVCEDADSVLVKRQMDNMPSVSSLLNITSGFLSDLLDIRVLATTNAPITDMDPALVRSGRLSALIHVGPLTTEEATQALSKILKTEIAADEVSWELSQDSAVSTNNRAGFESSANVSSGVLLATVYKEARERGWTPLGVEISSFVGVEVVEVPDYLKKVYPDGESFDGNGVSSSRREEVSYSLNKALRGLKR